MPTSKVPRITVTCSGTGWKCGGMVYPSGNDSRMVNGPRWAGSPSRTASLAPAGSMRGAAFHFIESGTATTTCCAGVRCGFWASRTAGAARALTESHNVFMLHLDIAMGWQRYYGVAIRVQVPRPSCTRHLAFLDYDANLRNTRLASNAGLTH